MPDSRKLTLSREELEDRGFITDLTNAIYDYKFIKILRDAPWSQWIETPDGLRQRSKYLETYKSWIKSSELCDIEGLDRFKNLDLINGTTQTFDEAYFKYSDRRLRIFRGEYGYHRRIAKSWAFLEDEPLSKNDYVIISAPFCSLGDVHPEYETLLDKAHDLNVPVIVDCAYVGTCEDFSLNVEHPAIESVSFSLSKGAGCGDIRSGIRFSNISDMNPISQQNKYNHTVLTAACFGLYVMENLDIDFIPKKYSKAQKEVCEQIGLQPTKCMHIALANGSEWDNYRVDEKINRVGIRKLVKSWEKEEI